MTARPRALPRTTRRGAAALLAVLALAAAVATSPGCSEAPEAALAKAREFVDRGDHASAEIQLKRVLKAGESAEARYLLGTVHEALGDLAAATEDFDRALILGADKAKAVPALLDVLVKHGRFREAIEVGARADLPDPGPRAQALATVALAHALQGRFATARDVVADALAADPGYAPAQVLRLRVAAIGGELADVDRELAAILERAPRSVQALDMKADLELARGRPREASELYARAIAVEPHNLIVRSKRVNAQIELRDLDAAQTSVDEMKALRGSTAFAMTSQALVELRRNRLDEAQNAILRALRAAPASVPSLMAAAEIALAQGNHEQAEAFVRKVVAGPADSPAANRLLIVVLLAKGTPEKALEAAESAIERGMGDARVHALAGEAALRARDAGKALRNFQRAAELDPALPGSRTGAALAHLLAGRKELGMHELEEAGRTDPDDVTPDVKLYALHMRARQHGDAIADATRVRDKQPRTALADVMLGNALAAAQDYTGARVALRRALALEPGSFPAAAALAALDVRNGQLADAKARFVQLLEHAPKSVPAMLAIAALEQDRAIGALPEKLADASGDARPRDPGVAAGVTSSPEALKWIERARQADRNSIPALLALAAWHVRDGHPENAIAPLQAGIVANPGNAELVGALGDAYARSNQPQQAIDEFEKALKANPDSARLQYMTGMLKSRLRDPQLATENLRRAIELDPHAVAPRFELAALYLRIGRPADAAPVVARLVRDFPDDASAARIEGELRMTERRFDDAIAAFRRAARIDPSTTNRVRVIDATAAAGRTGEADALTRRLVEERPGDVAANRYAADMSARLGQWGEVIAHSRAVLRLQPRDAGAWNNIAWAQFQAKLPGALASADKAAELAPNSAPVLHTLGMILVAQGRTELGAERLKEAVNLASTSAKYRLHLAEALIAMGDVETAKNELHQVLRLEPKGPNATRAAELRGRI